MQQPAYSSYRLFITERAGGGAGYKAVSEFKLFEDREGLGPNILTGGVATASTVHSAEYAPSRAIDGNPDTRWASRQQDSLPEWLRVDLPAPRPARSIYLMLNSSPANGPAGFELQGSNDGGESWSAVKTYVAYATPDELMLGVKKPLPSYWFSGTARVAGGGAASRVMLLDWLTGHLVFEQQPDPAGNWSALVDEISSPYMLVVTGPSGTRPQAHGPLYPGITE